MLLRLKVTQTAATGVMQTPVEGQNLYELGVINSYCSMGVHPIITFFLQQMPIPTQPVLLQYQCYVIYT